MSDFFGKIKEELIKRVSIIFLMLQGLVLLSLIAIHYYVSGSFLIVPSLVFFILEMAVLLFFLLLLSNYLKVKLGSREALSRTLFQNTRNIINNISHEYRTPLNAIMGFADDLYEKETDPDKREALDAIRSNSERLFAMSKKLIDFSSIETGLFQIDKHYDSVSSLLINIKTKYDESFQRKGLELQINDHIPSNIKLYFDFQALFEILSMLVENAVKFTEEGQVTIKSIYERGELKISISDRGVGIPDEKKNLVFELYRQGTTDLDREFEGVGMGLTIAAKLTQMHGGSISIEDNVPGGSVFHISFKCKSIESEKIEVHIGKNIIPVNLNREQKALLMKSARNLEDVVKVFDSGRIKKAAEELMNQEPLFKDLSERLIETARSFNETEFAALVEEMLEVSK